MRFIRVLSLLQLVLVRFELLFLFVEELPVEFLALALEFVSVICLL